MHASFTSFFHNGHVSTAVYTGVSGRITMHANPAKSTRWVFQKHRITEIIIGMRTCVRVREQPPKDPSCRLVLLMDTSLPPNPKVAAAGRFSQTGGLANGGATPEWISSNTNYQVLIGPFCE